MIKNEQAEISRKQLTFLLIGFLLGASLVIVPGQQAEHDSWLAILAGLSEGLVFILIYTTLCEKFPGKTVVQFNDIIYGPYLGKIVSIIYIWYFFEITGLNFRAFSDFFINSMMPETPMEMITIATFFLCASSVRNGIEVFARCSLILVPFTVLIFFGTIVLLIKDMELTNFLPVLEAPLKDFILASHSTATFPFGDAVVFLMILPFINNPKQGKSAAVMAFIIAGIILVMASMRNIAVLGNALYIHTYPSYQAVRLIDIGGILTRLEIIVGLNLLNMGFLKISVFYYGTVLATSQLFNLRSYLPLVYPIGLMIVVFSLTVFESNIEHQFYAFEIFPFYAPTIQFCLPLISLIVAKMRGLPKN